MNLLSIHNRIARRDIADRLKSAETRLATVQTVLYNVLARHGAQEFVVAELRIPASCFVKCDTTGCGTVRFSAVERVVPVSDPSQPAREVTLPYKMEFVGNEADNESEGTTHGEEAGQGDGVEAGVAEVGGDAAKA